MDFIQNEINYNLIVLYIVDFIQYELELERGFGMSKKHELVELINRYKIQEPFEYKFENHYNFIPLKDIKRKKEVIKRNGFLVYSKEEIENTIVKQESLYGHFKLTYDNCKYLKSKKISKELFTYRYYFYQEILENIKQKANKQALIVMINPAFADSQNNDPTINNIYKFLKVKKFKSFEIVNLYPIRMPKFDCLDCFVSFLGLNKSSQKEFLIEYLKNRQENKKENEEVILIAAWGDKYNTVAQEIFKNSGLKFKSYKKGAPAHFSSQRYNNVKDKGLYDFISFTPTEMDV